MNTYIHKTPITQCIVCCLPYASVASEHHASRLLLSILIRTQYHCQHGFYWEYPHRVRKKNHSSSRLVTVHLFHHHKVLPDGPSFKSSRPLDHTLCLFSFSSWLYKGNTHACIITCHYLHTTFAVWFLSLSISSTHVQICQYLAPFWCRITSHGVVCHNCLMTQLLKDIGLFPLGAYYRIKFPWPLLCKTFCNVLFAICMSCLEKCKSC